LFHPADGYGCVKDVPRTTNAIVQAWLKDHLLTTLATLSSAVPRSAYVERLRWKMWREGLQRTVTWPRQLPPLCILLIMDNLVDYKTPNWLCWCFAHGLLPLYTSLGGSWLNMAQSIQCLLKPRALDGQYPASPQHIIQSLEAVAQHWNLHPMPFVWLRKRNASRDRPAQKRRRLGASRAATVRPTRHRFLSRPAWLPTH
jgi:hypothetical protein